MDDLVYDVPEAWCALGDTPTLADRAVVDDLMANRQNGAKEDVR